MKNKEKIDYIDCRLYVDENDDLRIRYNNYTEQVLNFEGNNYDGYDDFKVQISKDVVNEYREKLKEKHLSDDEIDELVEEYEDSRNYYDDIKKAAQKCIDDRVYYCFYSPNFDWIESEYYEDNGYLISNSVDDDNPLFEVYAKKINGTYNVIILPAPENYSDVREIADHGKEHDIDADYLDEIKENYLKTIKKENCIYIGSECDIDLRNENDILKKIKFMMNENNF